MNDSLATLVLSAATREFGNQRKLAERALAQLDDDQFFQELDADSNSVAVIVKHVGGNLRSRWTGFLTTDGEKPDRNRDSEFLAESDSRASITALWERGWAALDATLRDLQPADLERSVTIRGQLTPVTDALNRSLAHTAQHVGQIILLAKHLRGAAWQTLSIPRGASSQFVSPPARPV